MFKSPGDIWQIAWIGTMTGIVIGVGTAAIFSNLAVLHMADALCKAN